MTEAQQYAYDSQGRLTAVRIGGTRNGSIAYKYKANQQVEKETSITNAGASKSYEKILTYYEKGIPIGESLTRDTESMLFQYIQQGSSLLKVPVSDIETRWWAEYAISSNGQLRSRTTFDHQRAWGYPGD